jgi:uncharacterized damage-inducible protein DinB
MSADPVSSSRSSAATSLATELARESKATRRVLERVPMDKLDWSPHPKAMTLGQLAVHVAGIPGNMANMARGEGFDAASRPQGPPAQPEAGTDFVAKLDSGVAAAQDILGGWSDEEAGALWRLSSGDREVFAIPRTQMVRTMLLNHWYHHRGQLSLYLRMLDVAVPAVYGRSADESLLVSAFGRRAARAQRNPGGR